MRGDAAALSRSPPCDRPQARSTLRLFSHRTHPILVQDTCRVCGMGKWTRRVCVHVCHMWLLSSGRQGLAKASGNQTWLVRQERKPQHPGMAGVVVGCLLQDLIERPMLCVETLTNSAETQHSIGHQSAQLGLARGRPSSYHVDQGSSSKACMIITDPDSCNQHKHSPGQLCFHVLIPANRLAF